MGMKVVRFTAPYTGDVKLSAEAVQILHRLNVRKIALYSSVQFIDRLSIIERQLATENIQVITSKPARASAQSQLLGCDAYHSALNIAEIPDLYLYIGDGMFHPRALLLAQKDLHPSLVRDVLVYSPPEQRTRLIGIDEIGTILHKYHIALKNFLKFDEIGVLVTLKPGQQQLNAALILEKAYPTKTFYFFVDDTINLYNLGHFPFIKVWVNTACPRIGFDDAPNLEKTMLNVTDALHAVEVLEKDSVLNKF